MNIKGMGETGDMRPMSNEERMAERNAVLQAKAEFYKKYPPQQSLFTPLEECLLGLLDPITTPEKALESLSSPLFSSGDYSSDMLARIMEYNESIEVMIFLAYTRFIVTRLPEANVDGIWEVLLFKTIKFSRTFCDNIFQVNEFASDSDYELYRCSQFNDIVPNKDLKVGKWLNEALSTPSKCPNPYIRLELFRLLKLFHMHGRMNLECLTITFIHTVCEIQPHHLYPSGNIGDVLFGIKDMYYAMSSFCDREKLQKIVSTDLIMQINEKNKVMENSDETKFLSNCVKIVGVFSSIACCKPGRNEKYLALKYCCVVLRDHIGNLVNCGEHLPLTSWMQFRHIIMQPPFRSNIIETIRNLTKGIINHKRGPAKAKLIELRDMITEDLSVYDSSNVLPGLLLSRQINGPTPVHQYSLQVRRIDPMCEENANCEPGFGDNPTSNTIPISFVGCSRWSIVSRSLPIDDCDLSDSNDNSDNFSYFSSSEDSINESNHSLESTDREFYDDDSSDNLDY